MLSFIAVNAKSYMEFILNANCSMHAVNTITKPVTLIRELKLGDFQYLACSRTVSDRARIWTQKVWGQSPVLLTIMFPATILWESIALFLLFLSLHRGTLYTYFPLFSPYSDFPLVTKF